MPRKIEYANIRAEAGRKNLTNAEMAERSGMCLRTLSRKLARTCPFTLREAISLRNTCFPDRTLEYLFQEDFCHG